jgi:hypothetical protein
MPNGTTSASVLAIRLKYPDAVCQKLPFVQSGSARPATGNRPSPYHVQGILFSERINHRIVFDV